VNEGEFCDPCEVGNAHKDHHSLATRAASAEPRAAHTLSPRKSAGVEASSLECFKVSRTVGSAEPSMGWSELRERRWCSRPTPRLSVT
jgi:hypothetical protein